MSLDQSALWLLIAIALVLAGAMMVAWLHFGRMRYVLLWAIASGAEAVRWVVRLLLPPDRIAELMLATSATALVSVTLVAYAGVIRNRRRVPTALFLLPLAVAVPAVGYALSGADGPDHALGGAVTNLYAAYMLTLFAVLIRPRDRRPNIAEYVATGAALLFAAFELGLAAIWMGAGGGEPEVRPALHFSALMVGLPVAYIAVGMAAILLIASDLHARLQALATRDPLTGALNRRGLEQALLPLLANARRRNQPLAVIAIDIGVSRIGKADFAAGERDAMLVAAADALNASIREDDVFGHCGDGEFYTALTEADAIRAEGVVQRMQKAMADLPEFGERTAGLCVFGIAEARPDDMAVAPLIRRARANMAEQLPPC